MSGMKLKIKQTYSKDTKYKKEAEFIEEYPHPFYKISKSGNIILANSAGIALLQKISPNKLGVIQKRILEKVNSNQDHVKFPANEIRIDDSSYLPWISTFPAKDYFHVSLSDISSIRANSKLNPGHYRLFDKVEKTALGIFYLYDVSSSKITYLGGQIQEILGYTKAELQAISENNFKAIVCENDNDKIVNHQATMSVAPNGGVFGAELKVRDKFGQIKWLNCRETVYQNATNNKAGLIFGTATDITSYKIQEQELVRQKDYYETILNVIPSYVIVFDKDLRFRYANVEAFKDKNTREWVIGKTQEEYGTYRNLPAEVMEQRTRYLKQARDEKKLVIFEETLTSKNGNTLYFLVKAQPFINKEGQVEFIISNGINITELKNTEQKVKASEGKNKAILRSLPDLMFIVDQAGKYLEINNHSNMALSMPENQIVGHTMQEVLPPDLANDFLKKVKQVVTTGEPVTINFTIHTTEGLKYREGRISQYEADKVLLIIRDITELKLNEIVIQEQNELIKAVMDTSPNLIFVKDAEGRYVFANKAFKKLFGQQSQDIHNKNDTDIHTYQEEINYFAQIDQQVLQNREIRIVEEKITMSNGEEVWFKTVKSPLEMTSGAVQVLGISVDITDEKRVKEELEKREELYRFVSENSQDMIMLHELDSTCTYASSAVRDLLGFQPEELIGVPVFDLMHPADLDEFKELTYNYIIQRKENYITPEHRKKRKDGSYIWVETSLKPILNNSGEVIKVQSVTRDVTFRVNAHAALLNSEKKYKDLVEYSQAYILSYDMAGCINSINPYIEKDMGYSEEEAIGRSIRDFVVDPDGSQITNFLEKLHLNVFADEIFMLYDKNERLRYVHFYSYKVMEQDIDPYVIAIGHDLTDRVLMEEQLKKAKEAAEESARTKENFLANMSHEIRTPLNGILGMAGLLSKTTLDELQKKYLKIIKGSSDNLLVIINDILDTAKIEAGKIDIENIPFDVADSIQTVFNSLRYKAEEKELAYVLKPLPFKNTILNGDPFRLHQVLLNLLNNAIKFTDEGVVSLSVTQLPETETDVTLAFSVRDTGIGIPKDKQEEVFDGFTQAYTSTTRKYGGTGLGLNICKNLVELQGGRIWVESQEGLGSIFKFTLTYPKSKMQLESTYAPEIDYTQLKYIRVLLAEDNEVNIYVAESILNGWGATVDVARNGKEAVALATQNSYDVVLMDIQMPLMNGLDATKEIRQLPDSTKSRVPIIALTANAIKGDAEKYLAVGTNDYVSKPFDEARLFQVIASQVSKKFAAFEPLQQPNKQSPASAQATPPSEIKAETPAPLFDLKSIYKLSSGNETILLKTKQIFINTMPAMVADLRTNFTLQNWEKVSEAAHKLRSTINLMHITRLEAVILRIEQNAKAEINLPQVEADIQLVEEVIQEVLSQLNKI